MITVNPLEVDGMFFTAIVVELPKTNLLMISNEVGYIMCGALDVDLLNNVLADRKIIAARAVGVKTIDDLLYAPLEKITDASKAYGWEKGMIGRDALIKIS
ncbi:YunC family protein [Virgibacillus byunsanensis]|uniref:YunC family protein n=1 Tax=Virgibacillus byunsanensis TaxID=570945 RepID=A0ABW3LMN5_9BACI